MAEGSEVFFRTEGVSIKVNINLKSSLNRCYTPGAIAKMELQQRIQIIQEYKSKVDYDKLIEQLNKPIEIDPKILEELRNLDLQDK